MRIGVAQNAPGPFVLRLTRQTVAQHRFKTLAVRVVGVSGFDHAALNARQHVLQRCRFTTPPAGDGGQLQRLPQQITRQSGHEAQQRIRFEKSRAGCVGHQHMAAAHGLQQAGHAQGGVGTQLQRVQPVVIDAFQEPVHWLQPLQGLEVQLFIANCQVIALHQTQTQIACQISVLEIGFVVGARCEQRDVGTGTGGAAGLDAVDQRAVGFGQALNRESFKGPWKQARDDLPVFQQIPQPRGCLGALGQEPPAAVCTACQVKCGQ